jgi:hypothetical protein
VTDLAAFKAIPINGGAGVTMRRGAWRQDIKATDLPSWVALYRGLRDRAGGRFAAFYAQPVEALEAAATRLGLKLPELPKAKGGKR